MRQTKAEVIADGERARKEATLAQVCLTAAVVGEVKWIRGEGGVSVGIVRPTSPTGGFLIVRHARGGRTVEAYYLEEWVSIMERRLMTMGGDDAVAMATLARRVMAERNAAVEAMEGSRGGVGLAASAS